MPAIHFLREFVAAGGLMSYSGSAVEADLAVQQTKTELFINVATAKALGIAIPPSLLTLADEVIE